MYPSEIYNLLASLLKQANATRVSGDSGPEVDEIDEEADPAENPNVPPTQPSPPSNPPATQPTPPQATPPQSSPRLARSRRQIDISDYHPWENPYTSGPNRDARARSINEYLASNKKDNLVAKPNPFATRNLNASYTNYLNNLNTRYKSMYTSAFNAGAYNQRGVGASYFKKFVPYRKNNLFIKSSSCSSGSLLYRLLSM